MSAYTSPWTAAWWQWFPEQRLWFAPPPDRRRCSHSGRKFLSAPPLQYPRPPGQVSVQLGHSEEHPLSKHKTNRLILGYCSTPKNRTSNIWWTPSSSVTSPIVTIQFHPHLPDFSQLQRSLLQFLQGKAVVH